MKKFLKENAKLVVGFLIVSISVPILILTPSSYGILSKEIGGVLVSYCGAILGGFLTLYGVWWTIENNKKDKREEISIQYLPIIQIESKKMNYYYRHDELPNWDYDETGKPLTNKPPIDYDYFEEYGFACELVLKNTGRGEIVEAHVSCVADDEIISVNYKYNKFDILPQETIGIKFCIDIDNYKRMSNEYYDAEIKIEIRYFDIMNKEYFNNIPIHILNREPFEYYEPILDEVISDANQLEYEIGNIKRGKI